MSHARFDYSGGEFGAPNPKILSKSWRLKQNILGYRSRLAGALLAGSVLMGEDAITVSDLLPGLSVYAGYGYGTYTNIGEIRAAHPGAKIVSIAPVVESAVSVQCLDIEPGNAGPGSAPAFMALPNHDGATKPIFYCSASDLHLVIAALTGAGYKRDEYFLWSAHWIGLHICGPTTCGYPQADATQYLSNNRYDSDVWNSYVFGAPNPFPTLALTNPLTIDPVNTVPAVHNCQDRLNTWKVTPVSAPDGAYGPITAQRVKVFQTAKKLSVDGVVGPATWSALNADPPAPPKPVPVTTVPQTVVTKSYSILIDRAIPGYKGLYATKVTEATGKAVYDHQSTGETVRVAVPGPGTYTVVVGAAGWENATRSVSVMAE